VKRFTQISRCKLLNLSTSGTYVPFQGRVAPFQRHGALPAHHSRRLKGNFVPFQRHGALLAHNSRRLRWHAALKTHHSRRLKALTVKRFTQISRCKLLNLSTSGTYVPFQRHAALLAHNSRRLRWHAALKTHHSFFLNLNNLRRCQRNQKPFSHNPKCILKIVTHCHHNALRSRSPAQFCR